LSFRSPELQEIHFSNTGYFELPLVPDQKGEGANVAMWDALELSEYLTSGKYNTLKEAIADFEIAMRKRAAIAAAESLENGERMHSEGALKMMLGFFNGH
jgi:hypothetical protein